jgi:hypothetical protein
MAFVHVSKGVGVASWALDRSQLSCRTSTASSASSWGSSCRQTLATRRWGAIAWLWPFIVSGHSCVSALLRWRLLLWWPSGAVVTLRWSRGASWKTRKSVSVEHIGGKEVVIGLEVYIGQIAAATYVLVKATVMVHRIAAVF